MTHHVEKLLLVYSGDSGFFTIVADIFKKAVGIEECALCEITHSAIGKRNAWKQCEGELSIPITPMHRNELPKEWNIASDKLPCVLLQRGDFVTSIVSKDQIHQCKRDAVCLQQKIIGGLSGVAL